MSLLDTIGMLFEKILLSRILSELSGCGLLRDEQFGFRPKHSTSLQLARLVERVTRNFGEKRLSGAVFLDVAKAFDTVWVNGLLFKLTALNFAPISLKPYPPTFTTGRSRRTSKRPHPPVVACGWRSTGGLISPVLFSLYVNDMPVPSRHVELAFYANDTAFFVTSRCTALLVSYLEAYLSDLER
jgi:hypothetical protein